MDADTEQMLCQVYGMAYTFCKNRMDSAIRNFNSNLAEKDIGHLAFWKNTFHNAKNDFRLVKKFQVFIGKLH